MSPHLKKVGRVFAITAVAGVGAMAFSTVGLAGMIIVPVVVPIVVLLILASRKWREEDESRRRKRRNW